MKSMKRAITIEDFREASGPILDARSPSEFVFGHIPGATNFPLFSDEERVEIGICYKKKGNDAAIQLGFDIVGPKLGDLVRQAAAIAPDKSVRIHCWRGGMRSQSVAWLLETSGMQVTILEGGYKSYRNWVREVVGFPRRINILGGLTGTGKTRILESLKSKGCQMLDLEGFANHRGSSFGGLGMPAQPSTPYFENLIAEELFVMDPAKPVWLEAESIKIGGCFIPEELFRQMKTAPAFEITRPIEVRLDILSEMYGQAGPVELIRATERIAQRLGGLRTKSAIELINKKDIREACRLILDYYDRSYKGYGKSLPRPIQQVDVGQLSAEDAALLLIEKTLNSTSELVQSA
jgi:tRNA 2-selenouridine synthase